MAPEFRTRLLSSKQPESLDPAPEPPSGEL
ncbi:hypothetical protein LINPERHAP2_LOCUS29291 [Linum perenne]